MVNTSRSTTSTVPAVINKPEAARKLVKSTTEPLDIELRERLEKMSSTGPLTKPKRRLSK
jgi:hypothetical protein